jgi:hypothetical protein
MNAARNSLQQRRIVTRRGCQGGVEITGFVSHPRR